MAAQDAEKTSVPSDISASFGLEEPLQFVAVSAGKVHSGAVLSDGSCFTWGGNELGQLGLENVTTFTQTPSQVVEIGERVASVACGYAQTIFILEDRSLMICGNNDMGQLGVEDDSEVIDIPVPVPDLDEPIAKVICTNFNCALSDNANMYIWGSTPNGMFVRPEKINGLAGMIREVAIGEDLIVVLDTNNFVYSWGRNEVGQLGLGDTDAQKDACSIDALNDREVLGLFAGKNFVLGIGRGATDKKENPLINNSQNENDLVVLEEGTGHTKDIDLQGANKIQDIEYIGAQLQEDMQEHDQSDAGDHYAKLDPEDTFGRRTGPHEESRPHSMQERPKASHAHLRDKSEPNQQVLLSRGRETDPLRSTDPMRSTDHGQKSYQLPSSIIDLYRNQKPTEAIYPIEEVDRLQREHKVLLQLVCAYEKTRQELVSLLNSIAAQTPRLVENLDPRDIQNVVIKENFIENKLFTIKLNVNKEIEDSGLADVLSKHKSKPVLPSCPSIRYLPAGQPAQQKHGPARERPRKSEKRDQRAGANQPPEEIARGSQNRSACRTKL